MSIMTRATNASPDASSKPTRKQQVPFHFTSKHVLLPFKAVSSSQMRVRIFQLQQEISVMMPPITEPNSEPGLY